MINKLFYFLIPICILGDEKPQLIGNLSLPALTQIAPLVSFGQHVIGKGILPELTGFYLRVHDGYMDTILPSLIYGVRDDLALTVAFPFTPKSKADGSHSSGMEDIFFQMEYAFFQGSYSDHTLQSTLVASVSFPTGSSEKNPPTGNGWFSYFLGTTFTYMAYNWYAFLSPGVQIPTMHDGNKVGNSYLYQFGFARYIDQLSPPGWIFDLMFEFDGTYTQKSKMGGSANPDSGGNVIFFTPSIWMSSESIILQIGAGVPIYQNLNGHQPRILYLIGYNFGVGFQF